MKKPKDKCLVKLSIKDIGKAIENYLNENQFTQSITVTKVIRTRSKKYYIAVEIK